MKKYLVSFLKNDELFNSVIPAMSKDQARQIIAAKHNIPIKFEVGTIYENESNHVSAVIELN